MNAIVEWAKQWPTAEVASITVLADQGRDPENRVRRNRLYEQFAIEFDYDDKLCQGGKSRPMLAAALTPTPAWSENIKVLTVFEYLPEALYAGDRAALELAQRSVAIKELRAERDAAYKAPIRWTLMCLLETYMSALVGLGFLCVLALLVWLKYRA